LRSNNNNNNNNNNNDDNSNNRKAVPSPAKAALPIENSGVLEYLQALSIRSAAGNREPTD
jgi:hypothetical protein